MKYVLLLWLMVWFAGNCCTAYAAPDITRILRKNNNLQGHRDGVSRPREPSYRTPKYYPESYPEYGRNKSSQNAGWQRVPDNASGRNHTPSYGVGSPRRPRRF